MTPDEAVSMLKGQLGNWTSTNIDAWIINELNAAKRRQERAPDLPWFLLIDTNLAGTNFTLSANSTTVGVPTGFLREDEEAVSCLYYYDSTADDPWVPLVKEDYSKFKTQWAGYTTLSYYDILKNTIYVAAAQTADVTLRMIYYGQDDTIVAGTTETDWLLYAPDLLIADAGRVIARQYLKDAEAAQAFAERVAEERSILLTETIARREAGYLRDMGGD